MLEKVNKLIDKHLEEVIEIRRDIHENPELGMEEHRTAALVASELKKLGLEVEEGVGKVGVLGLLRGNEEGKTLLLRADMDALPMDEKSGLDFSSKVKNVMHACGHDVHTATLLGAARVLSEMKENFKGNIKFVFQPAEESNPTGGARYMIEDGVLENPRVDAALALHIWPIKLGEVALTRGTIMAQSDRIYLKIKGKSAHGAEPHKSRDAIVAAGHIIVALQTIVSRNVDPMESAVVSLGTIEGGSRYNVLCDEVNLEGTVRTFSPEISELMPERITSICENIAAAFDCQCQVEYVKGYRATINDQELADRFIRVFKEGLGEDKVIIPDKPGSGGEDFSEFARRVPSVYYWLGIESELNKGRTILHNPSLIVDERAIAVGIRSLALASLDFLSK